MMRFDIMTLFPSLVETVLSESIIGRAQKNGILEVRATISGITLKINTAGG